MFSPCIKYTVVGQLASFNTKLIQRCNVYTSSQTYYDVLEIGRQADKKEIKKAYIKLCRKLHPDANPGDSKAQQKFVRLQEAYSTLSDPREKARYDVQMYRDIQERAKTKQKQNNYSTTTHTTENLSEQETIQRYYRQHQEQYEEWLRKTRQQADNRHQQQHQHNPNDWSGWENPNPDDPFYEVKSKIGKFLNRVSYADLFLLTAFGKMIALFLMMIILYSHFKAH